MKKLKSTYIAILLMSFFTMHIPLEAFTQDSVNNDIVLLFKKLNNCPHPDSCQLTADKIIQLISTKCAATSPYEADFSDVKNLTALISDNELLRIFTFGYKLPDGKNKFEGLIYFRESKKKPAKLTRLADTRLLPESPEFYNEKKVNWYGTQYYALVTQKDGRNFVYTLLGYSGSSTTTQTKVMDILTFNTSGKPYFGKKLIKMGNQKFGRIEFEYTLTAVFLLKYLEKEETIIFDQLAPVDPNLPNLPQYLGPTGVYNGFTFDDGIWMMQKNIDIRNLKTKFD